MRAKKFSPDYVTVLKYVLLFAAFAATNKLEKTVMPYSTAIFATATAFGYSAVFSSVIWVLSFTIFKCTGLLAYAGIVATFFIIVSLIYKKIGVTPRYEIILFATVAAAVFCLLGDIYKIRTAETGCCKDRCKIRPFSKARRDCPIRRCFRPSSPE